MDHERQGTAYDPDARGYERQGRKKALRRTFSASDHAREDWTPDQVVGMLEDEARGYNGILRQVLCTAAAMLRDYQIEVAGPRVEAELVEEYWDKRKAERPDTMTRAEKTRAWASRFCSGLP